MEGSSKFQVEFMVKKVLRKGLKGPPSLVKRRLVEIGKEV